MSKLMLIDATHPEETRVAVVSNGQIEDFDFEARNKRQLRGNIYLAKVTRVEPSLQAAFVDYGGNRHGFLAFNEIHPDYYQIPMADRRALLEEEAAAEAEEEAAADARAERLARRRRPGEGRGHRGGSSEERAPRDEEHSDDHSHDGHDHDDHDHDHDHDDGHEHEHADDAHQDEGDDRPQVIAEATARDDVLSEDAPEPETAGNFQGDDEAA